MKTSKGQLFKKRENEIGSSEWDNCFTISNIIFALVYPFSKHAELKYTTAEAHLHDPQLPTFKTSANMIQ